MLLTLGGVVPLLLAVSSIRDHSLWVAIEYNNVLDEYVVFMRSMREYTGLVFTVGKLFKQSQVRGVPVGDQGHIVATLVRDVLRFVPVFYAFTAVLAARLVHFAVGYMYTMTVKDACRAHVANVGVRHIDGVAQG